MTETEYTLVTRAIREGILAERIVLQGLVRPTNLSPMQTLAESLADKLTVRGEPVDPVGFLAACGPDVTP